MPRYSAFGLTIASELELPDISPGDGEPDVTIRFGSLERERGPAGPLQEDRGFRDIGVFRISGGREIVVDPLPEADPAKIRLILLGTAMAYLLRQRGWFPLHGSGVVIDGRAVLFLGPSGVGKSTTAAGFFADGHRVIADDVCPVRIVDNVCWLQPSQPRVRLGDESRSLLEDMGIRGECQVDKHSFWLESASARYPLIRVDRIYIIEAGSAVGLRPVPQLEAVTLLSANSFAARRRMTRENSNLHIRDCAAVASTVRVQHLIRSASLGDLKALVSTVVADLMNR